MNHISSHGAMELDMGHCMRNVECDHSLGTAEQLAEQLARLSVYRITGAGFVRIDDSAAPEQLAVLQ
jgi:hypothetical protein